MGVHGNIPGRAAVVDIRRHYGDSPSKREIQKRNRNAIRASIHGLRRVRKQGEPVTGPGSSAGQTKQLSMDPFKRLLNEGKIVPPPFDPLTLAVMPENNTELGPAIEAMCVNVESFGWRLESRMPVDERTPMETRRMLGEEQVAADNFFENAWLDENSIEEFRCKLRKDFETGGNFYVEFLEIPGTGELDGLNHLPGWTMRIGRQDEEMTEFTDLSVRKVVEFEEVEDEPPETPDAEGDPDLPEGEAEDGVERVSKRRLVEHVSYQIVPQRRFKRFRRYVQTRGSKVVWFKELGDPRLIDSRTGHVVTREQLTAEERDADQIPRFTLDAGRLVVRTGTVGFPIKWSANPVKHERNYSPRSPYGLPRYIGHLFSIFGSRAAEEINYTTFKNNNIPSAVITVNNGQLTDESVERLDEFVEATIASDDNYTKFLVLEGEPVMEGQRDPGSMKIEVKPLTKEQHTDALFVEYEEKNDDRVRRAWRFPPIFVGKSDDFTGATIDASRRLGDEQVFAPERKRIDDFFTRHVLLRLGIALSKFKSNSAFITENGDIIRMLAGGEKTGGLTPRIARKIFSRVLNEDLGEVPPDKIDPDVPYSLTLAQLMKSDSASEATGGGEPTSQGRSGLQVSGPGRDRGNEPAAEDLGKDALARLSGMLRGELDRRFGGFVGGIFDDEDEEAAA